MLEAGYSREATDRALKTVESWERFCEEHGLLMISIADLVRYQRQNEKLVRRVAETRIPTDWGDFTCYAYESLLDGETHLRSRSRRHRRHPHQRRRRGS